MTVTFCGHGDLSYSNNIKKMLYEILEKLIKEGAKKFLLGGYGNYDMLAAHAIKDLKKKYPDIRSVFVMPYLNRNYDKSYTIDAFWTSWMSI